MICNHLIIIFKNAFYIKEKKPNCNEVDYSMHAYVKNNFKIPKW